MSLPWSCHVQLGDDEVAWLHHRALAFDRGVGAMPFDDETQCRLGMPMCRRNLAWHDQLQPGEQRMGDRGLAAQSRIFQDQHASFGFLRGDQPAGLHQERPHHLVVVPFGRQRRSNRCACHHRMQAFPQRRKRVLADPIIEGLALGRRGDGRVVHGIVPPIVAGALSPAVEMQVMRNPVSR